eukprot:270242_1
MTRLACLKCSFIVLFTLIIIAFILIYYFGFYLHPQILNYSTITFPIPNNPNKILTAPKIVIGLGAAKSSSSTFNHLLMLFTPPYTSKKQYPYKYIIRGETNYWLTCHANIGQFIYHNFIRNISGCNLNEYLQKVLISSHFSSINILHEYNMSELIFMEKTPSYLTHYHTPNILTYYAKQYQNMYFYVLLRHPLKRLWSHYWMHYGKFATDKLHKNSMNDINKMENIILNDLQNIKLKFPLYIQLLSLLKYKSNNTINNQILELYKQSQMKEM